MSNAIPKEQQTAYQRWEMASFGEPPAPEPEPEAEPPMPAVDVEALLAEAREQIAAARESARREGLAEGLAQGYQTGMEQGRAQALEENTLLQQLSVTFGAEISKAREQVAQDLLDLALDLSKAMLKHALTVRPELVLPVVSEAIGYLPTLQQPALLFLHPEDALLVRERMGAELSAAGWRVLDEAAMERGGCRVETASNQIDASASSRWQRIAQALGRESEWLA
ncbi:flagellar assembly protein FliH [Noviherbaspirillum pedocola]|uniref:Flagellar assembly protein FliH n=1 Tax=Noviherbaspirillum pedocola TaxID=2801341 RepID=A0A934T3U2_9BURK|nr:flagellar assembly protein FliH [Noviherbaspirillum pedocola]MBK4739304.1 flagellar assembly protein FliH [Noviherbaspirillum pedocola]